MTTTVDLTVVQGGTKQVVLEYGSTTGGTFTPINITGWTAAAQIRQAEDRTSELIAPFATAVDGVNGKVTLTLPATVTAALTRGGFYDAKITSPSGFVVYLAQGRVTLDKTVTV